MSRKRSKSQSFTQLKQDLLKSLEERAYSKGTLDNYRQTLTLLETYIGTKGIDVYTPIVGNAFIKDYLLKHAVGISCQRAITTIIRRLDDLCSGSDFTLQRKHPDEFLPKNYSNILKLYLNYCIEIGNKKGTLVAKEGFCRTFLINLYNQGCDDVQSLNPSHVCKACIKIDNKDAWAVIRMFLCFLNQTGIIDADYAALVPRHKRAVITPVTYTEEEILKFENIIDTATNTGKRDYAMLLLATRLGMRAGDIVKLSLNEVDFNNDKICFFQEKTGEPLELPMLRNVKDALIDYIKHARPKFAGDAVFLRIKAPHLQITTSVLRFAATKYFHKAGINIADKKHGTHTFRSSLASSMVNDSVPYDAVRKILGHTDPDAIKHYARLDIERLREYAIEVPEPSGIFKKFLDEGIAL